MSNQLKDNKPKKSDQIHVRVPETLKRDAALALQGRQDISDYIRLKLYELVDQAKKEGII